MPPELLLSLRVALTAMAIVIPLGIAMANWLAKGRDTARILLETALTVPLVLPPSVIGFGLLLLLGRGTATGRWLNDSLSVHWLFQFPAAVLAAAIMALPLLVRPLAAAFSALDSDLSAAARVLGAPEATILFRIRIPLCMRPFMAGLTLAFARAVGEFGATLIVAGSVPGRTRTLSLAIYENIQAGEDQAALLGAAWLVGIMAVFLFALRLSERDRV